MRKKIVVFLSLLLLPVLCLSLFGCTGSLKDYTPDAPNLAVGATYDYGGGRTSRSMSLKGSGESSVTVRFGAPVTFNTVMLKSKADNIDLFEIALDGRTVYRQDEIGDVRTCWLGERTASELTVTVLKADGSYDVNFLGVYEMPRRRDFRITTYLETGDDGERLTDLDGESLRHVDSVILFNASDFAFRADSTLAVDTTALENALRFVRTANSDVKIILNLIQKIENDLDWPYNVAKTHTDAFTGNPDRLIAQIKTLLDAYKLDGIGFDYEYPQSKNDWKVFSEFLVKLKAEIGDKKISAAIQYLGGEFSDAAQDAVDYFEIMTYDFVGKNDSHSTFHDAVSMTLPLLEKKGIDLRKVNMGLPFYARPQEKLNKWELLHYWGEYKAYSDRLDRFTNAIDVGETPENIYVKSLYFNSYQMIADKTAFYCDYGAGGVMIWNYGSDVPYSDPLSLHRAVNDALKRI